MTTLHIDWTACEGRGLCAELLTGLTLDEWGYPLALGYGSELPITPDEHRAATEAVALCPRMALSLR